MDSVVLSLKWFLALLFPLGELANALLDTLFGDLSRASIIPV